MLAHPERREHVQFALVKLRMNSTFLLTKEKRIRQREI